MGFWDKFHEVNVNINKDEIVKSKCPKNSKVEVVWKPEPWFGILSCSYSGFQECSECIKKEKYPKNR